MKPLTEVLMSRHYMLNLTEADYHAERFSETPHLSASIATELILRSPYHAWLRHPKLGNIRKMPSAAMAYGTVIHALVLGSGSENLVIVEAENFKTKIAQTIRDRAISEGKTPILEADFDAAHRIVEAIHQAIDKAGFNLDAGRREQTVIWEEETSCGPIKCRGRLDFLHGDLPLVIDLKTVHSAHPRKLRGIVEDHGYQIQQAAYRSALRKLRPECAGREDFVWLFVEELPEGSPDPIMLTVARADGTLRELGDSQWKRACHEWSRCLKSIEWPGYSDGPVSIEASPWALQQEGFL
jgi:PDDEXK-like domain of unknown function (DUF3799)